MSLLTVCSVLSLIYLSGYSELYITVTLFNAVHSAANKSTLGDIVVSDMPQSCMK